jgi:predicted transcriptional regulator
MKIKSFSTKTLFSAKEGKRDEKTLHRSDNPVNHQNFAEQSAIADTTEQVSEQVTEQVRRILKCITKEPIGAREIMKKLGLRHRPTFLYEYLQPALNGDFIEMTQPRSPKSPTQKYRLTAKGKAIAEEGK